MMIMVIITLDNGTYQCLEDQELFLGHTQPLQAVDYQHALQKIVLALSNPYWLYWLCSLPCQRIGLGHNGNSRPMIIKIIKRHFFEESDLHLGEGEVCGKVKAAQLGERPVDEGEGQHLPRCSISVIVRCTYFVVASISSHLLASSNECCISCWILLVLQLNNCATSVQLDWSSFIWSLRVRSVKPGTWITVQWS